MMKGGKGKERQQGIPPFLPLIELQRGPEPHVDSKGPETPLQRTVGELGVDVGELGVDNPSRSASMVEPARGEKESMVTFKIKADKALGIRGRGCSSRRLSGLVSSACLGRR